MPTRPILVIGNKNYSSWSLRPWLLLRHHAVDFEEVRLPLDTPEFARGIAAWSPARTVPAMRHGDLAIWDSLAICEYANETFLDGAGWPRERDVRAVARAASAEMHSGFVALRTRMPMNCRRRMQGLVLSADVRRDIERVLAVWRDCRTRHGEAGPFLFGTFSIADAMYAPVALRFRTYGIEVDDNAREWMAALLEVPAMQEWLHAADAEAESLAATDAVA
jgi:glutathione S-transferase